MLCSFCWRKAMAGAEKPQEPKAMPARRSLLDDDVKVPPPPPLATIAALRRRP